MEGILNTLYTASIVVILFAPIWVMTVALCIMLWKLLKDSPED